MIFRAVFIKRIPAETDRHKRYIFITARDPVVNFLSSNARQPNYLQ